MGVTKGDTRHMLSRILGWTRLWLHWDRAR